MKIQFNTDKTINCDAKHLALYSDIIEKELDRYQNQITRVEVHITDQNSKIEGFNTIRCLLEARIKSKNPIAVSDQANTINQALPGAIDNLKAALEIKLSRFQNH